MISGDFNGDNVDDLAGLASDGRIFFTTDMSNWIQVAGELAQLTVGDFDNDGMDDLAGLSDDGRRRPGYRSPAAWRS